MTEVFFLIATLTHAVVGITPVPHAIHDIEVDENWKFQLNTTSKDTAQTPKYSASIYFNEWPAGVVNPAFGAIAAGAVANEETFIAALRKALVEKGVDTNKEFSS